MLPLTAIFSVAKFGSTHPPKTSRLLWRRKPSLSTPLLTLLAMSLLLTSGSVAAAHHKGEHPTLWNLDNSASRLSFVSVKAGDVAEAHKFGALAGGLTIKSAGAQAHNAEVNIKIDLASANTNIAVRDERMREHLFQTANFPVAAVHGHLPVADYLALPVGDSITSTLKLVLDLHGARVPVATEVLVSRLGEKRIVVASLKPVIVNASGFGLVAGIEKLRELAGLPSISKAVPVSFVMTFNRALEAK